MSTAIMDMDKEFQDLAVRWMAAGHEVVYERLTFRHKAYKHDLDEEVPIKAKGPGGVRAQMIMSNGHALVAGDVMPERADLATDMNGNLLPQHEFEQRYKDFLRWFPMVEGSEPDNEYIPNVVQYVSEMVDPFSESPGMVEIGYDANREKPPEDERTHRYDMQRDEMIEIQKRQGDALETTLDAIKRQGDVMEKLLEKRGPGRPRKDEARP